MPRSLLNSFLSGALSPITQGLVDLEGTRKGCRRLKNFQVLPTGGVVRRPGMIHRTMAHDGAPILVAFNYSASDAFHIEIGDGYYRILTEGGSPVLTPSPPPVGALSSAGEPLRYSAPWTAEQLAGIQWNQANNLLLLLHADVHPMQLLRVANDDWRLSEVAWDFPPLRDPNIDATTLACSVTALAATGTLTASAATFNAQHVGSTWQLTHNRALPSVKLNLSLTATTGQLSSTLRVIGQWEVFSVGEWTGTIQLERQISMSAWETMRSWESERDFNIQASGIVERETIMRLKFVGIGTAGAGTLAAPNPRAQITAIDPAVKGLVKITGYTSSTSVSVTVVRALESTAATSNWAEGAFSTYRGFPRAACFHDQRWVLGGVRSSPLTVFGSVTADLFNFERTTLEDGAFVYELAATESSPIAWIFSHNRGLIVATEAEEWVVQGAEGKPITPTSIEAQRKTSYGSDPQRVILAGSHVLYVQTGAFALREYVFDFATQNYLSPDILELADHLVLTGIKCISHAKKPIPVVYVVTRDGRLLACTYRRSEGGTIVAWSEFETDGIIEWVSVLYNEGESDSVMCVVTRYGNSRIEEFSPNHIRQIKNSRTPNLLVHLDAAVVHNGAATDTVSAPHLVGRTVRILAGGAELPEQVVAGDGSVTLDDHYTEAIVGLPYTSELQPMPFDLGMEDGTSAGRKTKAGPLSILFFQSGACLYSDGPGAREYPVVFRANEDETDRSVPLFTGWKKVTVAGAFRDTLDTVVKTDGPLPLNLLALSPTQQVHGA